MRYKKNIAVFISGKGSNALNIIQYFKSSENIEVSLIVSNRSDSGALQISKDTGVPFFIMNRTDFYEKNKLIEVLQAHHVQAIVLAGFLWLIPQKLIQLYPERIINIHPALLPKYGGKGMYGMNVHQAVKDHNEEETGITIHVVNEEYDKGKILLQQKVKLTEQDTPESIAQKVHALEYEYFPKTIEEYIEKIFV